MIQGLICLRLLDQRLNAPLGDIDGVLVSEVDCR